MQMNRNSFSLAKRKEPARVAPAIVYSLAAVIMVASLGRDTWGQRRNSGQAPASQTQADVKEGQAVNSQNFEAIAAQASAARESDKVDEAVGLYRQALTLRPTWAEGWWFLATLYYDKDNYPEAAQAFKRTAQLQQKAGA